MRPKITTLAKSYLLCFGLINTTHVFSLLGILSAIFPPPYPVSWWWHGILFLAYMVLPLASVLVDNYALYVAVAGVSLVRIIVEVLRAFAWTTDLHLMLAPLYALAAILSLALATERVASEVSAEILSLEWSQY